MDLGQLKDWALLGLLSGSVIYAATQMGKIADAMAKLETQIAVLQAMFGDLKDRVEKIESKD